MAEHPLGCRGTSWMERQLLLYLVCHRVLVGVSLLAAHVLVHRGHNLQDVVVRGKGCAQGRKGKETTLALRKRSQPTEKSQKRVSPSSLSQGQSSTSHIGAPCSELSGRCLGDTRSRPRLLQEHNPPKVWVTPTFLTACNYKW